MADIENIEDFVKMLFMGPQYFTMKAQQREREEQRKFQAEAEKTRLLETQEREAEEAEQQADLRDLIEGILAPEGEVLGTTFPEAKRPYSIPGEVVEGGEPVYAEGRDLTPGGRAALDYLGADGDVGNFIFAMNLMGGPTALYEEPEPEAAIDWDQLTGAMGMAQAGLPMMELARTMPELELGEELAWVEENPELARQMFEAMGPPPTEPEVRSVGGGLYAYDPADPSQGGFIVPPTEPARANLQWKDGLWVDPVSGAVYETEYYDAPGDRLISNIGMHWPTVESAAAENGVPTAIAAALVMQESGGNADAVSPAGAQGLTQLMPGTAAALGVTDPFNPRENAEGGMRYLAQQYDKYGDWRLALAAYNAGPGAVDGWIQRYGPVWEDISPYAFAETRAYVNSIMEAASETAPGAVPEVVEEEPEEVSSDEMARWWGTLPPRSETEGAESRALYKQRYPDVSDSQLIRLAYQDAHPEAAGEPPADAETGQLMTRYDFDTDRGWHSYIISVIKSAYPGELKPEDWTAELDAAMSNGIITQEDREWIIALVFGGSE